jgi:hypothetical protein
MKRTLLYSGCALFMFVAIAALIAAEEPKAAVIPTPGDEPAEATPANDYWLGVQLFYPAVPLALRAQLNLPENEGVCLGGVVPDSPAAKAGLAPYDIILKADDKKLLAPEDLVKAVEAAKDKEMQLEIIHEGKSKTVAVTRAKRPEGIDQSAMPPLDDGLDAMRELLGQLPPGMQISPQGPMRFKILRPGMILPKGAPIHAPLPGNMSVTIFKAGDKPAEITVTLDKDTWQVKENELDQLPEKVRQPVQQMLAGRFGFGSLGGNLPEVVLSPSDMPPPPGEPGDDEAAAGVAGQSGTGFKPLQSPKANPQSMPRNFERLEKRMEEMNRRMERMQQELHERTQSNKQPANQNQPKPAVKDQQPTSEGKSL